MKRIYGLDILRAIAILVVVVLHSKFAFPEATLHYFNLLPDGVSIFFVLSGYLIGTILLKAISEPEFSGKDLFVFWQKRWFRTLPAYFVVLGLLFCYAKIAWGHIPRDAWGHLFFVQSFFKADSYFFSESWSLCVEEWFYLLLPFFLYVSLKIFTNRKRVFFSWIVLVILIEFVAREYRINKVNGSEDYRLLIRQATIMRMDSIMYGVLAAFLSKYYLAKWLKNKDLQFVIGIALFIGIKTLSFYKISFHFFWPDVETIATLLVLPRLLTIKTGKGFLYKFFTFISTISYSLYLVNLTLFHYVEQYVRGGLLFYLVFCISAAYLLYLTVEQPFMKLRNKLFKEDTAIRKRIREHAVYSPSVKVI